MPKISSEKKQSIIEDYQTGNFSYKKLALKYLVSRQSVYWIINPEKQKKNYLNSSVKSPEKNKVDCKKYREKLKRKK